MPRSPSIVVGLAVILIACGSPAAGAGDTGCLASAESIDLQPTPSLAPGDYRVVFVADAGSKRGGVTQGTLSLRPTSRDDKSPRTGEPADTTFLAVTPLYGWLDAELERVGAPICARPPYPAPCSTDPVYPGVLVHAHPELPVPREAKAGVILTVATLSNLRTGELGYDGCGIGMFITSWDGECFRGVWNKWGRLSDGSGRYCLCPKAD